MKNLLLPWELKKRCGTFRWFLASYLSESPAVHASETLDIFGLSLHAL